MQTLIKGIHRLRPAEFRSSHALFRLAGQGRSRPKGRLVIACSERPIDPYALILTNFADLYVVQRLRQFCGPVRPASARPGRVGRGCAGAIPAQGSRRVWTHVV